MTPPRKIKRVTVIYEDNSWSTYDGTGTSHVTSNSTGRDVHPVRQWEEVHVTLELRDES